MHAPIVYLNGRFLDRDNASLSVDERGVYFADGVYEVVRYFNGQALTITEHLDRLNRSLDGIDLDYDPTEIPGISNEPVERNGLADARVYWQVTRGAAPRNHVIPDDTEPTIYLSAEEAPPPQAQTEAQAGDATRRRLHRAQGRRRPEGRRDRAQGRARRRSARWPAPDGRAQDRAPRRAAPAGPRAA